MYLKEIKAHGFKSFADKISLELGKGITGIVGPNGSGKSNVVDAVRWVLGEQSVKSLRGDGAMTDVIFSGSKSRNKQNVASVTLVFDNSDKYLPVDFTEVSIKRRVYQDGTNEYFLNGEKCRLKDVTSILLDSGIAKESFNIISQGKIEEILSNKPEDRRVVFEEAAGVLKYKRRKEDALRKLERTHSNMNRVEDIIHELEVQVEPLRIQKEKALEYQGVTEALEKLEVALITNDITTINTTYQEKKKRIDELNQEVITIMTSNTKVEAQVEEFKRKNQIINQKITDAQATLIEASTEVEKQNSRKQILLERKKYELEDTKLHDNIVSLTEKEKQLENELVAHNQMLKEYQETLKKSTSEIQNLEATIQENRQKKNRFDQDLGKQIREKTILDNRIQTLQENIENNGTLPYAVKNVLNNPKLRGIHNAIGNVIEVEEEYAIAISTSLGGSTNYIIVDNEELAKEAIYYLKNNNIGRATFFPMNVIKPKGIDPDSEQLLRTLPGFVGIASNLVKCEDKYRGIIQNQLGNVVVTHNIDDANLISRKIHYRYKIVTLEGDLLHVGGSLTGGKAQTSRNMIQDKYELQSLLKEQSFHVEAMKTLEEKINLQDHDLQSLEDKLYLLEKEHAQKEHLIFNAEVSVRDLEEALGKVKEQLEGTKHVLNNTLSEEEEEVINAYYAAVRKKNEWTQTLSELQKERVDLNESIEEFDAVLKKENSLFNQKNQELKNLEIEVNRADVKLDTLLSTLNETYRITYEKARQEYLLELEPEEARKQVNVYKRRLQEIGIVNLGAPEEYERVSERYQFLVSQREDLVNAENTLLEIIEEMDTIMKEEFLKTFEVIQSHFSETFHELFKGGHAELKLTDPKNLLETGIEIIASPPGKKLSTISLLSGGEKTFTAISLLFAILKSRPVPFCILDEVEAALDEVNVDSFGKYLLGLKDKTQFILITHKKKTMEYADILYGITMQESGVSKLVSVRLEEIKA